jgi:hypothetical protein
MIREVHSVTKSDFLAIMVPIHAAVYAAIILVAWHIFAAKQISNLRVDAQQQWKYGRAFDAATAMAQ